MGLLLETKPTYTIISVEEKMLDTTAANALMLKIEEQELAGSLSFVINLKGVEDMDINAGNILLDLHQYVYDKEGSLVFAELADTVLQKMKKEQLHLSLNLCPTMAEAVDILSMEILERDLLKE